MTGRIWLDFSNAAPASDAAVLTLALGAALRRAAGERVRFCARGPGLVERDWAELPALLFPPPAPGRSPRLAGMQRWAAHLPPETRALLRRAFALQLAAWRSLRPTRHPAPVSASDTAPIVAGDTVLTLDPATLPPLSGENADPAEWTLRPALPPAGFVLADGEIGEPGHTRHLLLAWRELLDSAAPGSVPPLVLAGHVGALATDVLAQLANSDGLGGHVTLIADPNPGERTELRRGSRFVIAPEPYPAWDRARLEARFAGCPCLSATASARALADAVRAWIATPPPAPSPLRRSWDDVAAELLAGLPS
jgi:hypothetical protein